MTLRRKVSHFLALVVVAALTIGLMAGPASAHKMSAKQKAKVARQLRKAVKKNPGVVGKQWFLKRASLVNFKLPVTIRLRGGDTSTNPNQANIDLGASLGQREIELGGSLAAEIVFHDSYDGGALGNVDVNILNGPKSLNSTSVPLLWNDQVSAAGTSWDSDLLNAAGFDASTLSTLGHAPGCSDIHNSSYTGSPAPDVNALGNVPFGKGVLNSNGTPFPPAFSGDGAGLPGVPIFDTAVNAAAQSQTHIVGFAPAHVDSTQLNNGIDAIAASGVTGDQATNPTLNNNIGANPDPFPAPPANSSTVPGAPRSDHNAANTVLRTNALSLQVAAPGTNVQQDGTSANGNSVSGSQNIVIGKSGGQANLFGRIPGKADRGIDVTVNLATRINSILRIVDQDGFEVPFQSGNWPAAIFTCSQIWTGWVQNYIPGVHLAGTLKIAPAITKDGKLRIAKASLSSPGIGTSGVDAARVALAACLVPKQSYNQEIPANVQVPSGLNNPLAPGGVNTSLQNPDGSLKPSALPANPDVLSSAPSDTGNATTNQCNSTPSPLVANSAYPGNFVSPLGLAQTGNGYTVTNSGSTVSVAGDLTVKDVEADILVGDV